MTITKDNTIITRVDGHYGYYEAYNDEVTNPIYPGHLIERAPNDRCFLHQPAGGAAEALFAYENAGDGRTVSDPYPRYDRVRARSLRPGDMLYAYVGGALPITEGKFLQSAGDGTLIEADFLTVQVGGVVAQALELYNPGGGDTNPSLKRVLIV